MKKKSVYLFLFISIGIALAYLLKVNLTSDSDVIGVNNEEPMSRRAGSPQKETHGNSEKTGEESNDNNRLMKASVGDDGMGRMERQHHLITMLDEDPASAYDWLLKQQDSLDAEEFYKYQRQILTVWALSDPEAAGQVLESIVSEDVRNMLLVRLAEGWAEKDIDQAFNWLSSLEDMDGVSDDVVTGCYMNIMNKYAEINPVLASKIFLQLESTELQNKLIYSVLGHYVSEDYQAATDWTLALENEDIRNTGVEQLLHRVNGKEEEGAIDNVMSKILSHEENLSGQTLSAAFELMSASDPKRAAESITQISEEKQSAVTSSLIGSWLIADPSAAKEWVNDLSEGKVFEESAKVIAQRSTYQSPVEAMQWASRIQDVSTQERLRAFVVNNTEVEHLESVTQYLAGMDISNDEHTALKSVISERLTDVNTPLIIP